VNLDIDEAAREICRVGRSLYDRGYVHATAGNISVRLADGFLITPTDACLGALDPQRLAFVGHDGVQHRGDRANKTLALHRRIYEASPGAGCVIHTHSTHLVALTLLGVWHEDDILPPITPYFVMKVGHVPLVPYHRTGDPAVADLVAARITAALARCAGPRRAAAGRDAGPAGPQCLASHPRRSQRGAGRTGRNRPPVAGQRTPGPGAVARGDRCAVRRVQPGLVTAATARATA
jgi:3-dehydro-4-phosphotetronate decarboxylase